MVVERTYISDPASLPLANSVGYQVRLTHRLMQRALQSRIEKQGVTLGMWYYLRALWEQDGVTQRELSRLIGTMEPTTLSAIASMEAAGLVRRERDGQDRRKMNVFLTPKGRKLQTTLLPSAIDVVRLATRSLTEAQRLTLLALLRSMQSDLAAELSGLEMDAALDAGETVR